MERLTSEELFGGDSPETEGDKPLTEDKDLMSGLEQAERQKKLDKSWEDSTSVDIEIDEFGDEVGQAEDDGSIDIDVSEFEDEDEAKPEAELEKTTEEKEAGNAGAVRRELEAMIIGNSDLATAVLKEGIAALKDGGSGTPIGRGLDEMSKRIAADGVSTPDEIEEWLKENLGAELAFEKKESVQERRLRSLHEYRQLEPGSAEELQAGLKILKGLLDERTPKGTDTGAHAVELRAALRTQSASSLDDRDVLSVLEGVVNKKVESLGAKTREEERQEEAEAEISAEMVRAFWDLKKTEDPDERLRISKGILTELLPEGSDINQFVKMLDTFAQGDTKPERALAAVHKMAQKKKR